MKNILKKFIAILIIVSVSLTYSIDAHAKDNESDEIVLGSQVFSYSGLQQPYGIAPNAIVYQPGDIRIDDVLGATSGRFEADSQSAILSTLVGKVFDLIEGVPVIGTIYTTGQEILNWTMAFNSDLSKADYTKSSVMTTWYSFRNFTHRINAYTDQHVWKEVGTSLSRYYYKHTYASVYNKDKGDYVSGYADYTHSNGYAPHYMAQAPNYMNYSNLASYGYECYVYNRYYRESY